MAAALLIAVETPRVLTPAGALIAAQIVMRADDMLAHRCLLLDPESVIGRELHDRFAEFDESFTGHSRIWAVVVKLIGLTAMCSKAVIDLEKQVIELRREVRSRDKE